MAAARVSIAAALTRARAALSRAGIEESEARLLVAHVARRTADEVMLMNEREAQAPNAVDEAELARVLAARCAERRPLAHITRDREFWSLPFEVSDQVLVPRPDTETLIEQALAHALPDPRAPARIAELGVGSGCALLSLLHERPRAHGVGVDQSLAALSVARRNALRLRLAGRTTLLQSDWWARLKGFGPFQLIISNPPYIAESERSSLSREVLHEPPAALFAGESGLDAYVAIARGRPSQWLALRGTLLLEVGGEHQADAVRALFADHDPQLRFAEATRDLAGRTRCLRFVHAP